MNDGSLTDPASVWRVGRARPQQSTLHRNFRASLRAVWGCDRVTISVRLPLNSYKHVATVTISAVTSFSNLLECRHV